MRNLQNLPKAELHLHLEGAMRRSTLEELCNKYNDIQLPADTAHQTFDNFGGFVDVYVAACEVIREESDLNRLVLEVAQDAKTYGATWIELAPSFTFYADRLGGKEATLKLLAKAAEQAETETGVGIGYVVSIERHLGVEAAEDLASTVVNVAKELTIHGRSSIVGFGLHGPEEGNPPAAFQNAFEMVCKPSSNNENDKPQQSAIASLPHAGEIAPTPGTGAKSVQDAIQLLHAKRIAHGVLAANDEAVIQSICSNNICLDVCVSSNYLLKVVDKATQTHPLPKLLQRGVTCTINSDDPLLFGCTLLSEYELCRSHLKLSDDALAQCAKASFQYSCAPRALKEKNFAMIDEWLQCAAT